MNGWWRRCVKDRLSVRRMCRLVLVSCALGLLVCTALIPGYSEDMHGMIEAVDGKDHVKGGSSSGVRKGGAAVWMGKKDRMGLNVRNDHITNHFNSNGDHCGKCAHCSGCISIKVNSTINNTSSHGSYESIGLKGDSKDSHDSRGDHGAYDHPHGSFESDHSDKDTNISKGHHGERNDNQIQRSIDNKDERNSSSKGKDSKIGDNDKNINKRNSLEKHEMSSIRHLGYHRNSSDGHNNHDDHGERKNSHENRVESNKHRRNSFQRDSSRKSSRIWRFITNGDQSSLGHRSHGNSRNISGHKNNSSHSEDSHIGDSNVASTGASSRLDNGEHDSSASDIKVF